MSDPLEALRSGGPSEPDRERVLVRRRSRRFLRRRWRQRVLWILGGLALITIIQIAWTLLNLHGMVGKLRAAEAAAKAGDFASARRYTDSAHGDAERASWGTWGPHMWALSQTPWVGNNLDALRAMTSASVPLTGDVSDDAFSLQQQLEPRRIRPVNSTINPGYFVDAVGTANDLARRMAPIVKRVDNVSSHGLLPGLSGGWDQFRAFIDDAGFASRLTRNAVTMMPDVLGAEGTRHYLIVFQNNAEFRSTGGIPGAFSDLTVTDGHMTLGPKLSGTYIGQLSKPALPLTDEEVAIFTERLGEFPQDTTLTPDFPRAASMLAAMYTQKVGTTVDGVISVDPVVLSHVLAGTGPITLDDGSTINSANAVAELLNKTYVDHQDDPSGQDNRFSAATHDVFDALVHGRGDAGVALKGVFTGINEGRAMVWLAKPSEESGLLDAPVAKALTTALTHQPDVGVYLNDSTSTKLDYYVDSSTQVVSNGCVGGQQILTVTTTVVSHVPPGLSANSPSFVGPLVTDTPGDLLVTVYGYGPYGGKVIRTELDGSHGSPRIVKQTGHPVVLRTFLLPRGQTKTLMYTFQTAKSATGDPILRTTPTASSTGKGLVGTSSC